MRIMKIWGPFVGLFGEYSKEKTYDDYRVDRA